MAINAGELEAQAASPEARQVNEPPPPPPRPGSPEALVANLTNVLKAAPTLRQSPGVALTVAKYGGPVTHNAQTVGALAHVRAMELASQRHQAEQPSGPNFQTYGANGQPLANGQTATPRGQISTPSGNLSEQGGQPPTLHNPGAALKAIEGVGTKIHGLLMPPGAQEALSPGTQSIPTVQDPNSTVLGTLKGMVTGSGSAIKQNVMDQINMPSPIYRLFHDVEARHGPIGLLEAAHPTVPRGGRRRVADPHPGGRRRSRRFPRRRRRSRRDRCCRDRGGDRRGCVDRWTSDSRPFECSEARAGDPLGRRSCDQGSHRAHCLPRSRHPSCRHLPNIPRGEPRHSGIRTLRRLPGLVGENAEWSHLRRSEHPSPGVLRPRRHFGPRQDPRP